MEMQTFKYDNKIVKYFLYATLFWAIMAFLFGVIVATLKFFPELPDYIFGSDDETISSLFGGGIEGLAKTNGMMGFGRLRMIHTTFAVFAFVGNGFFLGAYYSMQRLCKTRMGNDVMSWVHFWTWQLFILLSLVTFLLGMNTTKEYAEHEWPLDILIAISWIIFGVNMLVTLYKRRVRHIYVAIWFYLGSWVAIAIMHIFNNLEVPVTWSLTAMKSYSIYAGVQDALVQWWYGHNAVAFFLTTPMLGLMYYFIPKAANRPVFSYKLSIIHFWSLIFIYMWAGPHHLLYTALPAWVQAVGTGFSIMLWAPSWGGMLNGLLTLRGAWDKVREDPVLKFLAVAVTAYGMATFEGPMLATKTLNKIGHFTDWIPAHVHVGTLGWNGFLIFGMIYWLVPKMWNTTLASRKSANTHFWIATLGILFWVIPMYVAGWTQGLMWQQFNEDGTLTYGNFLQTVTILKDWLYPLRAFGGLLYLIGATLMVINVWITIKTGHCSANEEVQAPALAPMSSARQKGETRHGWIERMPNTLTFLSLIAVSIGGIVEIVPTIVIKSNVPTIASVKPYTPLELEGRDLYIREACNSCHTQMVRPFRDEVKRYGEYSKPGEFVYDHPFLWGSQRSGPDLHRQGGKNPDVWHYRHMWDPRDTSPGSIMPRYPWLIFNKLNTSTTEEKMKTLALLGVPYEDVDYEGMTASMEKQAKKIEESIFSKAADLKQLYANEEKEKGEEFVPLRDREIVALIAYLQRLGTDISLEKTETTSIGN